MFIKAKPLFKKCKKKNSIDLENKIKVTQFFFFFLFKDFAFKVNWQIYFIYSQTDFIICLYDFLIENKWGLMNSICFISVIYRKKEKKSSAF